MFSRDYYAVLGISRTATAAEIKHAYKLRVFARHPDRNPDDPKAGADFMQIVHIYNVLSDQNARRRYDLYGPVAVDDATARVWQQTTSNPNGWKALTGEVRKPVVDEAVVEHPERRSARPEPSATPTRTKKASSGWSTFLTVLGVAAGVGTVAWAAGNYAPYDPRVGTRRNPKTGKFQGSMF